MLSKCSFHVILVANVMLQEVQKCTESIMNKAPTHPIYLFLNGNLVEIKLPFEQVRPSFGRLVGLS